VIITAHMTWPLKMDTLESLAHALAAKYPELGRLQKAKPFLTAAQNGRNRASHGHWIYHEGKVGFTTKERSVRCGTRRVAS
jgi:hypothetical protein